MKKAFFGKIGKALPIVMAVLAALLLIACPTPEDPSYGNLTSGSQRGSDPVVTRPDDPDIIVYGVRLGDFAAVEGKPGTTIANTVAGTIFMGEEAVAGDATDLPISYKIMDSYNFVNVRWAVSDSPVAVIDNNNWNEFPESGKAVVEGVFPSAQYLVFEVTDEEQEPSAVSYYKYLVTWGENGTGIESISIAGRVFTNLGIPSVGTAGQTGITSGTIYLTAAQIAANRPIQIKLRSDSRKAAVLYAPSYPTNDTVPGGDFTIDPPTGALANNSRIFIRVRSLDGSTWANYRLQVAYANNAVLGTFTVSRASTSSALGTPRGSWNADGLVDGATLNVKNTRLVNAVAAVSGGTNPGTVTWAFVPNLQTEPVFLPLDGQQTLGYNGYIYVKLTYTDNYINIYRFPIGEKPLSDDPSIASISIKGVANVPLGTPAKDYNNAVAGAPVALWTYQMRPPVIEITPTDSDADLRFEYGKMVGETVASITATIPNDYDDGNSIIIKSTAEDGKDWLCYKITLKRNKSDDATIKSITFNEAPATLGTPANTPAAALAGSVTIYNATSPASPRIVITTEPSATVRYAKTDTESGTPSSFVPAIPTSLANNNCVWVEVVSEDTNNTLIYKIKVTGIQNTLYGRGEPDPAWAAAHPHWVYPNLGPNELLSVAKMPDVSYWNSKGHMHDFPDPFHFANGNAVKNLADWENRRQEIRLIVMYYYKGMVPSVEADVLDITFTSGGNTISVKHRASGRTLNLTAAQCGNLNANPAGAVETNRGKMAANIGQPSSTIAAVCTLYGISPTDASAPSLHAAHAWLASVLLTAVEGIDLNGDGTIDPVTERLANGWYSPDGLRTNGGSRNGKQAMTYAALGESRGRSRLGATMPQSSGGKGMAIERFIVHSGRRLDVTVAESWGASLPAGFPAELATKKHPDPTWGLPVDPLPMGQTGAMVYSELKSHPYHLRHISNGDSMVDPAMPKYTGTVNQSDAAATGGDTRRMRMVRGWAPYFDDFDNMYNGAWGAAFSTAATVPYLMYHTGFITDGYNGIESYADTWRAEDPAWEWNSRRFAEFTDLHNGLGIDLINGAGSRTYGILCTMPLDGYFQSILQAPGICYSTEGWIVPRNNPPGEFANWVLMDEVYKFYGEQEGEWDKYIWRNGILVNTSTHLGSTTEEGADFPRLVDLRLAGKLNTAQAMIDANVAKIRNPPFQIDDPQNYIQAWRKVDWGRPGHPTIAERVRLRVEPVLADYYNGELVNPKPANYNASTNTAAMYQTAAKSKYVPTGPKFKEMDWRGLTDEPELMQ